MDDRELAAYQAALLELLEQGLDAAELSARAREDPALAPFREYIDRFDPRCVEIATVLVKAWGRRRTPAPERATLTRGGGGEEDGEAVGRGGGRSREGDRPPSHVPEGWSRERQRART